MKKKTWIVMALVLLAGILAYVLLQQLLKKDSEQESDPGVSVIVTRAQRGPVERRLSYSGTLLPKSRIAIVSKIPGRVEQILIKKGDLVSKNQVLVQIEDDAVRLQMEQAYASWQAAEARYDKAKKGIRREELENAQALLQKAEKDLITASENFKRAEQMYKGGVISKAKFEEAESDFRSARTELENARRTLKMMEEGGSEEEQRMARSQAQAVKAGYELAKLQVDFTRIKAPESGMIVELFEDEGNIVDKGMPILILVQDDPILAGIPVPEKHYGQTVQNKESIEVWVSPEAYPDSEPFLGRITSVSPTINPHSRTFILEAELENESRLLRPGMYIHVDLVMEKIEDALLIPRSALLNREGEQIVFIVEKEESQAIEIKVKTGIINSGKVQILTGLSGEELVIAEGNSFLEHGQRVKIIQEK